VYILQKRQVSVLHILARILYMPVTLYDFFTMGTTNSTLKTQEFRDMTLCKPQIML